MNEKRKLLVATICVILSLTVTYTVASSSVSGSPLYIIRMEQVSNKMSFLTTGANEFTYRAEDGYTLNYDVVGSNRKRPYSTTEMTCIITCQLTCPTICNLTCDPTCPQTCTTCEQTCHICEITQDTCDPAC